MKTLIQSVVTILILTVVKLAVAGAEIKNTVLIFVDDLGYADTGPYGADDIPTPHIDRLAREGVVFTQCYVPGPPCCPSRSSLIMGMYPQHFGKYGMSRGLPIPRDKATLAGHLKSEGFQTGHIGKWDIGARDQPPLAIGFTESAKKPPVKVYTAAEMEEISEQYQPLYNALRRRNLRSKYVYMKEDGSEGWLTDYEGDMAVRFIEEHHDKPFFLYYSPEAVHSINLETPERLRERTTATGVRRALAGAIVSVDDQVGKILDVLDRYQLREDTLIIFSSDNGPNPNEGGSAAPYRGGKFGGNTQYEGWVHIPAIISLPGEIPEGTTFHGLSSTLDFYSTITGLNGQETPEHCDGVNLIPYLQGEKDGDPHEYIFWLNNDPDDSHHRHLTAVRWKDYRLYKSKQEGVGWQLFNIRLDPEERDDIAAEHPEVVQEMKAKFDEWRKHHVAPPARPWFDRNATPPYTPAGYGMWDGK
jgi:arylsulfatase A-like enzyme